MKHLCISLTFLTACFLFSCRNEKPTPQSSQYFVHGTNHDTNPDLSTIQQTLQKIQSAPNKFIIKDSTIIARDNETVFTFQLFNPFNKISKNKDTLKCSYVLIPQLNHNTPLETKEIVLKNMAKQKGLYEIQLYCSMHSYYEQIKNDAPANVSERNKKLKIEWEGFIGGLYQGNYFEYELETTH